MLVLLAIGAAFATWTYFNRNQGSVHKEIDPKEVEQRESDLVQPEKRAERRVHGNPQDSPARCRPDHRHDDIGTVAHPVKTQRLVKILGMLLQAERRFRRIKYTGNAYAGVN